MYVCIWNSSFDPFRYTYRLITKLFHLAIVLNLFSKEKVCTFYRFQIKASKENSIFVQLSTVWLFFLQNEVKDRHHSDIYWHGERGFAGFQAYHVIRLNTRTAHTHGLLEKIGGVFFTVCEWKWASLVNRLCNVLCGEILRTRVNWEWVIY